jgi:hypothetical protein
MKKMGFEHSQPQSVYRHKNRALILLMLLLSLAAIGYFGDTFFERRRFSDLVMISVMLFNMVNFGQMAVRTRLIMSPSGISVTFGHRLETDWSNVERIQLIPLGFGVKSDVPCLVLRQPIASKQWIGTAMGIPAEFKGRVIPIIPSLWERMATLEEELYRYLSINPASQGQLSVPINFAASVQRRKRFMWKFAAAMAGFYVVILLVLKLL